MNCDLCNATSVLHIYTITSPVNNLPFTIKTLTEYNFSVCLRCNYLCNNASHREIFLTYMSSVYEKFLEWHRANELPYHIMRFLNAQGIDEIKEMSKPTIHGNMLRKLMVKLDAATEASNKYAEQIIADKKTINDLTKQYAEAQKSISALNTLYEQSKDLNIKYEKELANANANTNTNLQIGKTQELISCDEHTETNTINTNNVLTCVQPRPKRKRNGKTINSSNSINVKIMAQSLNNNIPITTYSVPL